MDRSAKCTNFLKCKIYAQIVANCFWNIMASKYYLEQQLLEYYWRMRIRAFSYVQHKSAALYMPLKNLLRKQPPTGKFANH